MPKTIFDLVNAKDIASYIDNSPSNTIPYLGATLFPSKKQVGLDLSWIKGANGAPIALKPAAFDAKASVRDRIGVSKVETEMPFFREAMRIGEKDRQQLLTLLKAGNEEMYKTHITRIYDDVTNLVNGANVQPERMIMQLLSTGRIAITANGLALDYDYQLPAAHKEVLAIGEKWSESTSTPVQDIETWMTKVQQDSGVRPNRAIINSVTMGYLVNHLSIRKDVNPLGGENIIFTQKDVINYFKNKLDLSIAVYDKVYVDEVGTTRKFFPDGVFTLIPQGTLGNTWYGTTPEEADLLNGQTDANVSVVNTGVAVTTVKEVHPVNVQTIVSEIVMPSFENINQIFIATVA